ncbi:MAG TPA: secondary thiamine-phosphate synthase enzyme YjbQ [Phycisphaerae bacterium]|jgi:secondary thiamine-phosphate synthase enzyme
MLKTEQITTRTRFEVVDITQAVRRCVREMGPKEGLCVVYVPHTTAGVTINENADPDVKHDLLEKLAAMVPKAEKYYRHDEGNSDSHVKTALMGPSVTLIIDEGKLVLGTWQGVYFCEFDGPRTRKFHVKVMPG